MFVVPQFAWPLARHFGIRDVRWKALILFTAVILAISLLLIVPHVLAMRSMRASEGLIDAEAYQLFRGYMSIAFLYFPVAVLHACFAVLLPKASSRLAILQFWMFHIASMLQFTPNLLVARFVDGPAHDIADFHYLSLIVSVATFISLLSVALLIALPIWTIISKSHQGKSL